MELGGVRSRSRQTLDNAEPARAAKNTVAAVPLPAVSSATDASSFEAHSSAQALPEDEVSRAVRAGAPSYFRTYEQVKTAMHALSADHPELVKVEDVGDSGEKRAGKADRDILALRLGSPRPGEPRKPTMFLIAGEHAREIANPEIALRWAQGLAAGYGKDARITAALDRCEVVIVPMVNPDGHAVVEEGLATGNRAKMMQRKNTQGPGGSGVDLNRNYPFHWGGPGASSDPRDETFRGPSAASEAETQAVVKLAQALKLDANDVFVSLHSYSELILYPWGDTREESPDHAHFVALGEAMASLTDEGGDRYAAIPAVDLYPTTGTSDDHIYATHGTAAVTLETGETFLQSDTEYQATWKEVAPTLDYALDLTGAPFAGAHGPMVRSTTVQAGKVEARVSDAYNGKQQVKAAEAVSDPTAPAGQGIPLAAQDGAFDSAQEVVTGDVTKLTGDKVYVRAQDSQGNWGPAGVAWRTA